MVFAVNEFIKLSWEILEHRCRYYVLSKNTISDYDYDLLERKYEELALELNQVPHATNMVGFDMSRMSCKLVYNRLTTFSSK